MHFLIFLISSGGFFTNRQTLCIFLYATSRRHRQFVAEFRSCWTCRKFCRQIVGVVTKWTCPGSELRDQRKRRTLTPSSSESLALCLKSSSMEILQVFNGPVQAVSSSVWNGRCPSIVSDGTLGLCDKNAWGQSVLVAAARLLSDDGRRQSMRCHSIWTRKSSLRWPRPPRICIDALTSRTKARSRYNVSPKSIRCW